MHTAPTWKKRLKIKLLVYCGLKAGFVLVTRANHCDTENQLFQYNPSSEENTENGHEVTFRNDIMPVLGLDSGYTAKYGLNPREFPRELPWVQAELSVHGTVINKDLPLDSQTENFLKQLLAYLVILAIFAV